MNARTERSRGGPGSGHPQSLPASRGERARLLGDYEAARVRAARARLALVIQREAVGLRHHRVVDQQFPEPPRRPGGATSGAS